VRYGYRRVHVLLRREGWMINVKKTPRRRVKAKLWDDRRTATRPNETWAMDFVHDQLATGRRLRILTVVDTFSRYVPAIDPQCSYRGEDVVTALDQACADVGYPESIRVDQVIEAGKIYPPALQS
jgi:putative transposase